jgi:hypothetical protein
MSAPDEPNTPQKKFRHSDKFNHIFTNAFRVRVGDNDVGLTFSLETDDIGGEIVVVDQAQMIMTPKTLKVLSKTLSVVIGRLEKEIGEIEIPQQNLKEIETILSEETEAKAPATKKTKDRR